MHLLYFLIINIFAAFFAGVVGLGHALVATPLSLVFLSKNTVFTSVIVAGGALNYYLSRKIEEPLDTEIFKPLLMWAIIGMPFGIIILKTLPLSTLKIYVGSMSILLAIALLFLKVHSKNFKKLSPVTGLICGLMQTSTSMTGPPIALFLSASGISKNATRKLFVTFFFWISIITLPLFAISGILTIQGVIYGICAVPFILLAGRLGNWTAHVIPQKWYRNLTLITVCITGAIAIYSGIG